MKLISAKEAKEMVESTLNNDLEPIMEQIEKRRQEREKIVSAWNEIESINKESAFSMDCFRELQARISSKLAFIDRSIQDHKLLL